MKAGVFVQSNKKNLKKNMKKNLLFLILISLKSISFCAETKQDTTENDLDNEFKVSGNIIFIQHEGKYLIRGNDDNWYWIMGHTNLKLYTTYSFTLKRSKALNARKDEEYIKMEINGHICTPVHIINSKEWKIEEPKSNCEIL